MPTQAKFDIATWRRPLRGSDPRDVEAVRNELLARAIAAYSQAEAIGLVHPGVVNVDTPEGRSERRAIVARVERDGRCALHLQTLHVAQNGAISAAEAFVQDAGEAGDEGWIGVPPTVEVNIDMPPPAGAPTWGPVGEG